jgi:hypothetical protein
MKVKLIDLGNAVPIDRTDIYYGDFEIQSVHYRAPEVPIHSYAVSNSRCYWAYHSILPSICSH